MTQNNNSEIIEYNVSTIIGNGIISLDTVGYIISFLDLHSIGALLFVSKIMNKLSKSGLINYFGNFIKTAKTLDNSIIFPDNSTESEKLQIIIDYLNTKYEHILTNQIFTFKTLKEFKILVDKQIFVKIDHNLSMPSVTDHSEFRNDVNLQIKDYTSASNYCWLFDISAIFSAICCCCCILPCCMCTLPIVESYRQKLITIGSSSLRDESSQKYFWIQYDKKTEDYYVWITNYKGFNPGIAERYYKKEYLNSIEKYRFNKEKFGKCIVKYGLFNIDLQEQKPTSYQNLHFNDFGFENHYEIATCYPCLDINWFLSFLCCE